MNLLRHIERKNCDELAAWRSSNYSAEVDYSEVFTSSLSFTGSKLKNTFVTPMGKMNVWCYDFYSATPWANPQSCHIIFLSKLCLAVVCSRVASFPQDAFLCSFCRIIISKIGKRLARRFPILLIIIREAFSSAQWEPVRALCPSLYICQAHVWMPGDVTTELH